MRSVRYLATKDLDLRQAIIGEALGDDQVGFSQVLPSQRHGVGVIGGTFEQSPGLRRCHQHPIHLALVEMAIGIRTGRIEGRGMRGVFHRHDPMTAAHELPGQGHGQRRLPGSLLADYRDDS